jgi:hypothetical protein
VGSRRGDEQADAKHRQRGERQDELCSQRESIGMPVLTMIAPPIEDV